jgi:hypothetical protein
MGFVHVMVDLKHAIHIDSHTYFEEPAICPRLRLESGIGRRTSESRFKLLDAVARPSALR